MHFTRPNFLRVEIAVLLDMPHAAGSLVSPFLGYTNQFGLDIRWPDPITVQGIQSINKLAINVSIWLILFFDMAA